MKIAGQRETNGSSRDRQNSKAVSQVYEVMIPALSSTRAPRESAIHGNRDSKSQITAPATRYSGSGLRPSNTCAPAQVTAKAVNNNTLARSMLTHSGADP